MQVYIKKRILFTLFLIYHLLHLFTILRMLHIFYRRTLELVKMQQIDLPLLFTSICPYPLTAFSLF